ncbi:hypothetical protein [Desmospora activa]|uniref:hypothetical protein n=1 Tax=Desmospora activa TaxID=500615 RepID=UPI0011B26F60|nr:hypothetical protein [Desmospora activa]
MAWLLIPSLLGGCSLDYGPLSQAETASSQTDDRFDQPIRLVVNGEEKVVQEAGLITPEGKRLDMTQRAYIRDWNKLLQASGKSVSAHDLIDRDYPLVWVIRIRGEEPFLFRLGSDGAYWRGKRYRGEVAHDLYAVSMAALAQQRLTEITAGSSFRLHARDTGQQSDWSDEGDEQWINMLTQSEFQISDPGELEGASLFPAYEVEVRGLSQPASLQLLDEHRFLLVYGAETYLFEGEDSGYRRAQELLLPQSLSSEDIRSLLEGELMATGVPEQKQDPYPPSADGEEAVRQWLRKAHACNHNNRAAVGKELLLTLYFQRAEQVRPVEIFENGYRLEKGPIIPCHGIDRQARSLAGKG